MKKLFIFLITILGINLFSLVDVNAYSFYEGEYIDGIYITKESGGTKYYQKARFFNLKDNGKYAYCVEPFAMFNEDSVYERSIYPNNLTLSQMVKINMIAHFGYQYENHTDKKWYAITQYMIWKAVDPTANIYFTDTLNGNKIDAFTDEINEINNLVNEFNTIPSIHKSISYMAEGGSITLTDTNNIINKYQSTNSNVTINGNKITINNLKEGHHRIEFTRSKYRNGAIPFYYSATDSQDMTTVGDLNPKRIYIEIEVKKTSIEITKIDADNKNTTPKGDASLIGAIYNLYDQDMNKINELIIGEDNTAKLENLDYGKYFIKEEKPGVGYQLDTKVYEITIDKNNPNIKLTLENKVIEKKLEISKNYGEDGNFSKEKDISFDIYNSKDELFDTITTNENGYASIILPYGKYNIKQKNTTEGYKLLDNIELNVEDNITEKLELYDYKIKVPNTYHEEKNYSFLLILFTGILHVKKMLFC